MADYEVLGPGGHARLVSDIKAYVNRADGVGTTQLADESVTMDKLGDDVTDELDGIVHDGDPLNGNALFGELAEGVVLTADDVYTAPPKGVEVYGVSTQAGTPTPDAPVPIKSVDDLTLHVCGKNLFDENDHPVINGYLNANSMSIVANSAHICTYLPCASDVSYAISKNRVTSNERLGMAFTSETPTVGVPLLAVRALSASQYDGVIGETMTLSLTAPSNAKYLVVWLGWSSITLDSMQIELGSTATTYAPYVGASVTIPLSNNVGRSLPDGTRDELVLTYQGPSTEHEGWGVFSKTLVQRVKHIDDVSMIENNNFNASYHYFSFALPTTGVNTTSSKLNTMSSNFIASPTPANGVCYITYNGNLALLFDMSWTTKADALAALAGVTFDYALATPTTTDLGTVELPILPNPLTAWADGGSAQPTMAFEYERDVTIVIEQLEAQIEELLTS